MNSVSWIGQFCEGLNQWQINILALMVDALLTEQESILSHLAGHLTEVNDVALKHCTKRINRFLGNDNFDDEAVTQGIIDMIWPRLHCWNLIPVIIDWTPNEKRNEWKSLFAEIPLKGRGIPLMSWSFPKDGLGGYLSQNKLERDFVRKLFSMLPDDDRIVLVGDRGFARASFFSFLDEMGIDFIIRVPMNVWVECDQHTGELGELSIRGKELYSLTNLLYHKEKRIPLKKVVVSHDDVVKDDGTIDPWFLATNRNIRPSPATGVYGKRMTIEEDFKEAKSHLGWSDCRIRKTDHYNRFTTVLILALVFSVLVGTVVHRRPTLLKKVSRMKDGKPDTSMTFAGLKLLRRGLVNLKLLMRCRLYNPL